MIEEIFHNGMVACFRKEVTCAYIFGDKAALDILLSRFKLLNNDR